MSKLAGKSPDDEGDDSHAAAKMQVLQELRDMAMGMMGDKVKGLPGGGGDEMHGVEVMAPDKEGLKKGLDLAQQAVPGDEDDADSSGMPGDDSDDDMSPEEIDAMIEELQEKKRQAQMKA